MKPWLKKSLKIFLVLLLLFTCAWWIENSRGARAWKKAEQRAADAGISLELASYQPAPVPDEENLLKNNLFFEEWNGDVEPRLTGWDKLNMPGTSREFRLARANHSRGRPLDFTQFFDDELSEKEAVEKLSEASFEVQARLDRLAEIILSYPAHPLLKYLPTVEDPIPGTSEIDPLLKFARCFGDQAILGLRVGRPQIALRNIQVLDKLADCFGSPTALQHLVANALRSSTHGIIWEGLRLRQWDEHQLNELLGLTDRGGSFDALAEALKLEQASSLFLFNHAELFSGDTWSSIIGTSDRTFRNRVQAYYYLKGPAGWSDQRKAICLNDRLDHLGRKDRWNARYHANLQDREEPNPWSPLMMAYAMPDMLRPVLGGELQNQTRERIAHLAILLELHFLKHGSYPNSLDDLEGRPKLLDATDPQERPLAYDLDAQGRPQIWTVREAKKSGSRQRFRWQYHEDRPRSKKSKKSSPKRRSPPVEATFRK